MPAWISTGNYIHHAAWVKFLCHSQPSRVHNKLNPTLNRACDSLTMLELKLIQVSKKAPGIYYAGGAK